MREMGSQWSTGPCRLTGAVSVGLRTCVPHKGKERKRNYCVSETVPCLAFSLRLQESKFGVIYSLREILVSLVGFDTLLDLRDL